MSRNDQWFANPALAKFPGCRYNAQAPVIFMHIPKTAGVALTEWLDKALTPKYPVRGFDRVLFGDFQAFDTFAPSERNRIYVDASDVPANGDFVSAHMAFSTLLLRYARLTISPCYANQYPESFQTGSSGVQPRTNI